MGSNSILPELSLDVKPTFIPKSIGDFLVELTKIGSISEKIRKIDDFVGRLEDEMRKIDPFKRELPLCVLITNDAILALKEELAKCRKRNPKPIFEEFIPLKKKCIDHEKITDAKIEDEKNRDKKNWMSSVQLWNTNDSNISESDSCFTQKPESITNLIKGKEILPCENRGNPRAFLPFKEEILSPAAAGLSLLPPRIDFSRGISNSTLENKSNLLAAPHQQSGRKQRRCWSPELHRRFVDALEKLGGSQVATPKQIRDLMQVEGLTNDEVKSHLQKYRLHSRRIPSKATSLSNQSSVDLGGLWLQKDNCGDTISKQSSTSQSRSPPSPFQFSKNGVSIEEEDYDYEDSDEGSNPKNW